MSKKIVLEVRDDISEKYYFSHVFLLISSLWCLSLSITAIADNKLMELCYMLYIIFFITCFLMPIILKYIDIFLENNSSHLNDTIQ